MSNILIVDDEPDLAEVLTDFLSSKGHNVKSCLSAEEGLSLINQNKYELILSDIKMGQLNGIDFFKKCKSKEDLNSQFVLMTGYADIITATEAYDMGVGELLSKPFDLDTLNLIVNFLLDIDDPQIQNEKFIAIPISDLISSTTSSYDLFIKISNKFVCITKSGQGFTNERIENFSNKGVKNIYLRASDYAKYTDLQFAIANNIKSRPLNHIKKAKAFNHLISTVSNNAAINKIDKNSLSKAMNAFENYSQLAFNNSQMGDMLLNLTIENIDLATKNSMMATISSCVADLWKWNSPKIQSRLVMSALLCDVGLKESKNLLNKKRIHYTKEEVAEYEEHPLRSFKILSEIGGLPEEILHVALQHHENAAGHGFPQKLQRNQIHAFSKIIHAVNEFVDTSFQQEDPSNVKLTLDKLLSFQRKIISEQVLKSLYIVFNVPVPKELEGLLLPNQINRLI